MTTPRVAVAGIGAAIEAAEAARDGAEAVQLELLPSRFAAGSTEHGGVIDSVRRAGRPAGARNVATARRCEYVQRHLGDPLIESARWAMHSPESLAFELGCSKLEAFRELEAIRRDLCRYMHAPRAPEDGSGQAVPPAFSVSIGGVEAGADGAVPWAYLLTEDERNQRLIPTSDPVSHGPVSHEDGKPL